MKATINKLIVQLGKLHDRAEDYADSDNENTVDRYTDVPDYLQEAIDALEQAVACLDT